MLKNSLYNLIGAGIRLGLSILVSPLLIGILGLESFGIWVMLSAVITLFGLAEVGLSVTSTVFFSQDLSAVDTDHSLSQSLTTTSLLILVFGSIAAVGLFVMSPVILRIFPVMNSLESDTVVEALKIGSLLVWSRLLQLIPVSLEQAHQKFGAANLINTMQLALMIAGLLFISQFGARFEEFVLWQAVISFGALIAHILICRSLLRQRHVRFVLTGKRMSAILKYSFPSWLSQIGSAVFQSTDRIIVGAVLGPSSLAIYSAITLIAVQINNFSAIAVQPRFGLIAQAIKSQNQDEALLLNLVKNSFVLSAVLALGIGGLLIGVSAEVMQLMLPGVETGPYILAFQLALIIYSLYSLNTVGTFVLYGFGNVGVCAGIVLFCSFTTLVAIALGATGMGLLGAIVGNAIFIFTVFILNLAMRHIHQKDFQWLAWTKVPLLILFVGAFIQILTVSHNELRWGALTIQGVAFLAWVYFRWSSSIKMVISRFLPRLSS